MELEGLMVNFFSFGFEEREREREIFFFLLVLNKENIFFFSLKFSFGLNKENIFFLVLIRRIFFLFYVL